MTGVALEILIAQQGKSLNTPFLPIVMSKLNPQPQGAALSAAQNVTLADLASMETGLFQYPEVGSDGATAEGPDDITSIDGAFGPYRTTWADISDYLSQPPTTASPGTQASYNYNNTNYAILQGCIELLLSSSPADPQDYTNYVTENVLVPAGMDTSVVNPIPCPSTSATLAYAGPADMVPGAYHSQITLVGASGWIASARELIKFMIALRGTSLLPQTTITSMFSGGIGAWSSHPGTFGTYYFKDGGLTKNDRSGVPTNINTALVKLAEGYDIVVLANGLPQPTVQVRDVAINAFDARGLSSANLPPGPQILAAANGASYLAKAARGGFVAILGSGLIETPASDWTDAINGGHLPWEVSGVRVRVGTQWAYVEYVSAGQVNCILPSSVPLGIANVELSTPLGGTTVSLEIDAVAPGLFTYALNGTTYAAAVYNGPGTVYVAATGALPGEASRPAMAGDLLVLYGTGMGLTNPQAPDGIVLIEVYPAANLSAFATTLGGKTATVLFAGIVEAGLFQLNIQVPSGVGGGDQPVVITVNQLPTQANVMLTMKS
jgi:uncharacterized protein (TIGR03437 family)